LRELARTHPNIDVRREAVETLGESMAPGEAVELLTRVVREDPDTEMQRTAVESLGPIDDPSARKALFELARTHPSVDVRREAVEALAEAPPSQEVVDLLARIVREDKSPDVQSEAVEALGEISDGRGLSEVAQFALTHPVRDVRHEAIETLAEHAPPATSLDVLKRIVADERDEDARQDALEALAELPDGAGIPALIDVARSHPNQEVRREALKRLVESDDPRARAVLDRALTKP
jgi:HEAT repeat protein